MFNGRGWTELSSGVQRAVEVVTVGKAAVGVGGGVDGGERVDVDVGGRRWGVEE
jgi:hypothetical protein